MFFAIFFLAYPKAEGREEIKQSGTDSLWKTYSIPHYKSIYNLSFTSQNNGWATGEGGVVFSYNGSEWMQIAVHTQEQLFSLSFTGEKKGYATGSRGTILLYKDGEWKKEGLDVYFRMINTVNLQRSR